MELLEVGTKVKYVGKVRDHLAVGDIGRISEVVATDERPYLVDFDEGNWHYDGWLEEDEVTPIS